MVEPRKPPLPNLIACQHCNHMQRPNPDGKCKKCGKSLYGDDDDDNTVETDVPHTHGKPGPSKQTKREKT